jgi:pSer/pThr/pTyr-binding forkhead associated (FHA) protein
MDEAVPFLVATVGPIAGKRIPITAAGITLGREPGVDVVIPSDGVSRQHARVLLHNGAVWVQDQGSRNGVFVNEKRVVRHKQLSPGDALTVGGQTFTVEVTEVPSDPMETGPTRSGRPRSGRNRSGRTRSGGTVETKQQLTTAPPPRRRPFTRGPVGAALVVGVILVVALVVLLTVVR